MGKKFNMPSSRINDKFIEAMIEVCEPLTGAIELINNLHNKVNLGMITNGFNSLQQARLDKNGMRDKFKIVVTSEQATYAKPSPKIFDYAFKKMNQSNKERVLMIGDNSGHGHPRRTKIRYTHMLVQSTKQADKKQYSTTVSSQSIM